MPIIPDTQEVEVGGWQPEVSRGKSARVAKQTKSKMSGAVGLKWTGTC
jgi:putative aminopeptidase FrvX